MSSEQDRIGPAKLVLIAGPSGAGKDTLIALAADMLNEPGRLHIARRTVTRQASEHEEHRSVSLQEFEELERAGKFWLAWRAHDLAYAIPVSELDQPGKLIIASVSRSVLMQAKACTQDISVVLITAPPEILHHRIAKRGREIDIDSRLAGLELSAEVRGLADLVVENVGPPAVGAEQLLAFLRDRLPR